MRVSELAAETESLSRLTGEEFRRPIRGSGPAVSSSIFTFPPSRSSLPVMNRFWFSANYYFVFFGYNRRGLQSRVR
jgi:hypothetical protein